MTTTNEVATLSVNNTSVYASGDYLFPQVMSEAMGLDWEGQKQRIERSAWSEGWTCVMQVQVPGDNQARPRFAMHHWIVPMWIAGIEASRVNPDARPSVEAWQREIAEVLAEHYYPTQQAPEVKPPVQRFGHAYPDAAEIRGLIDLGAYEIPTKYGPIKFDTHAPTYAAVLVRGMVEQALAELTGKDKADLVGALNHVAKDKAEMTALTNQVARYARAMGIVLAPPPPPSTQPVYGDSFTDPDPKDKGYS
jgi:P22_AR N-terminal domain